MFENDPILACPAKHYNIWPGALAPRFSLLFFLRPLAWLGDGFFILTKCMALDVREKDCIGMKHTLAGTMEGIKLQGRGGSSTRGSINFGVGAQRGRGFKNGVPLS